MLCYFHHCFNTDIFLTALRLSAKKCKLGTTSIFNRNTKNMSSLWFCGWNRSNRHGLTYHGDEEVLDSFDGGVSRTLRLCEWSESKQVVNVTTGEGFHIYSIKTELDEILCSGFIREIQERLPSHLSPFYIIPDAVYSQCLFYFGAYFNEYWSAGENAYGQCGVGHFDKIESLSRVEIDGVWGVRSGCTGYNTLWMKYDGSLYGNGHNLRGQIGTVYIALEEAIVAQNVKCIHYK